MVMELFMLLLLYRFLIVFIINMLPRKAPRLSSIEELEQIHRAILGMAIMLQGTVDAHNP